MPENMAQASHLLHVDKTKNMKSPIILFIISLFAASIIHADETEYARILKERDDILSKMVAFKEAQLANGTLFNPEELASARLALWTLRRDTAKTSTEKIKQHELIVDLYEKQLGPVKRRYDLGLVTWYEVLTATDALLQAKQTLEEMKLAANNQTPNPAFPKAGAAGKNQVGSNGVTIVIQNDGTVLFNGKKAAEEQLARLLSQVKAINRDIPVLVSMDENIPAKMLAFVMDACRKEGLNKISMQTR